MTAEWVLEHLWGVTVVLLQVCLTSVFGSWLVQVRSASRSAKELTKTISILSQEIATCVAEIERNNRHITDLEKEFRGITDDLRKELVEHTRKISWLEGAAGRREASGLRLTDSHKP